jgi:RNA polymerase subunit RPABC4/transcription elongation factor Spt4
VSPDLLLAILKIVGIFVGVSFLVFWVGLVWWVSQDVLTRTTDKIIVSVAVALTAILGPVGVLIYLVVRPRQTLKERIGEVMEQEMLLQASAITICPTCEHLAQEDFLACPHCGTILKKACVNCGKLLAMDWDHCAFCGAVQPALEVEVTEVLMEQPVEERIASRPVLETVRQLLKTHTSAVKPAPVTSQAAQPKASKTGKSAAKRGAGKKDRSGGKKR